MKLYHFPLIFTALAGTAVYAQPVWTDILTTPGTSTMQSGDYFRAGSGNPTLWNISLSGIQPQAKTLSLPVTYLTGDGSQGGPVNCGTSTGYPVSFIESYYGTGIKGVGFLGQFNNPSPLTALNGNIFQAVFFGDTYCYNGGREYGFFLATYDNQVYAYWGTNENLPTVVQAQIALPGVNPNTTYYFEIYPVSTQGGASCGLQVLVLDTNFQIVLQQLYDVNSNNFPAGQQITAADPGFCPAVTASSGYAGYVSANITPSAGNVQGSIPPASSLNLFLDRVFVGK